MKKIEEQWKTIEEFPDYEISNFGKCRVKRDKQMLKKSLKQKGRYIYSLKHPKQEKGVKVKRSKISIGILVAKAFVENPNGYKHINYLDGNLENPIYTNIQWKRTHLTWSKIDKINLGGKRTREEQLIELRRKIELAERFEQSLINGTEQEFVYSELKDICLKIVNGKLKTFPFEIKEEAVEYVTDKISQRIKRGSVVISFDTTINKTLLEFYREYKQQMKTVQINERIM
jgi:hypothetical protein